jgi:hypothetical protein
MSSLYFSIICSSLPVSAQCSIFLYYEEVLVSSLQITSIMHKKLYQEENRVKKAKNQQPL